MDITLFALPLVIFVAAFLYESFLSLRRLSNPGMGKRGYVGATWEITHTLLVFSIVMLAMLHTVNIDLLSNKIFIPAFLAVGALFVRAGCYVYIFYIKATKKVLWVDWLFAFSHAAAAGFLVDTAWRGGQFLAAKPDVNSQFIPYFIPGLILVLAINVVPLVSLYKTKD